MTTILLHGFWGQPKDWNPVLERLPLADEVWTPDFYESGALSPTHSLQTWTQAFLHEVKARFSGPVQLVGYSMGGRLALQALVAAPELFSRSFILSSLPYLNESDRPEREKWERGWSEKFLMAQWSDLEDVWQDQPVLASSVAPIERRRSLQLREMLGLSLLNWSPRLHPFGLDAIEGLSASVDFAFGALDQKYVQVAKLLVDLPVQGRVTVIPQAGHRLPVDALDSVVAWIKGETI